MYFFAYPIQRCLVAVYGAYGNPRQRNSPLDEYGEGGVERNGTQSHEQAEEPVVESLFRFEGSECVCLLTPTERQGIRSGW